MKVSCLLGAVCTSVLSAFLSTTAYAAIIGSHSLHAEIECDKTTPVASLDLSVFFGEAVPDAGGPAYLPFGTQTVTPATVGEEFFVTDTTELASAVSLLTNNSSELVGEIILGPCLTRSSGYQESTTLTGSAFNGTDFFGSTIVDMRLTIHDYGQQDVSENLRATYIDYRVDYFDTPAPPPLGSCNDPATKIHDIQGAGLTSPFLGMTGVNIEGVVIGDFEDTSTELRGFFVQEEDDDADSDLQTSEGIFVFNNGFGPDVNVGDVVRLQGDVTEYDGLTEITDVTNLVVCSSGPSVSASTVTFPLGAVDDLEQYEGMLISIPQTLYVTGNYTLGRYGEVELSVGGSLDIPTNVTTPGTPALNLADLNARSRIQLDDGSRTQNPLPLPPYLGDGNTLRRGDSIPSLTGVLSYSFDRYEVHPTDTVNFTRVNTRDSSPPDVGGTLKVASFNVLNYFSTIDEGPGICGPDSNLGCRGADTADEFMRQRDKLINAIVALDADIVGLMELENNATDAIQDLVNGLNLVAGSGTYNFIDTGTIGTDAIKVAFIYQPADATPIGSFSILDASVDPTFNDTKNRPALAQTFEGTATGEQMTIAVNHFKSKGSSCDDIGDLDANDGQGNCNLTRSTAATALVNWLATDPTGSGDPDYLIIGDLNAYAKEDPISAITGAGYTDLIKQYEGTGAYSYEFDGEAGYLDHALANTSLSTKVASLDIWHINADEPSALDYNEFNQPGLYNTNPYRSSDHDPVLIGLSPDSDSDGLPDGSDPDTAAEAVTELPPEVFDNQGDPQGQRNAILTQLDNIEQMIKDGDIADALRKLKKLHRKVDGCPDVTIAGEMADKNDWIVACDAQRDIRTIIDLLITNLSS